MLGLLLLSLFSSDPLIVRLIDVEGGGGIPIGTLSKSLKINWLVTTSLITARYLRINQDFAMFGSD